MNNENITKEENTNEIPSKVIRSAPIARELLRQGNEIIDIKPRKDNKREFIDENGVKTIIINNSSVYVFKEDNKFWKDFDAAKTRRRRAYSNRRNNTQEVEEGPQMED